MASSGEDTRKKRDCDEVDTRKEEKPKKVRANHEAGNNNNDKHRMIVVRDSSSDTSILPSPLPRSDTYVAASTGNKAASESSLLGNGKKWDIESALIYLVQIEADFKEYLTYDESAWVTFRVGHAGDASTIASWYRQSRQLDQQDEVGPELEKQPAGANDEEETTSNMLEVWLADGMGNEEEGNPPSLHTLVAHVHQPTRKTSENSSSSPNHKTTATKSLGSAALITVAFVENERVLRVEWMGIDPELSRDVAATLEERMWLRLSTLSVMTACQVVTIDRQLTLCNIEKMQSSKPKTLERLYPSAE
jgi:hypothetical protein